MSRVGRRWRRSRGTSPAPASASAAAPDTGPDVEVGGDVPGEFAPVAMPLDPAASAHVDTPGPDGADTVSVSDTDLVDAGGVALQASHVWLAYRAMLGRDPGAAEVAAQLAAVATPDQLLEVVRASAEYALKAPPSPKLGAQPTTVNWWHPESAAHTHAPGSISSDAVAVVGRNGILFLHGGSNSILEQFTGDVEMDDAWASGWADLMRRRVPAMTFGGRPAASVVVPDKLAVYRDLFPATLPTTAPRPVERLLGELDLPLLYPVEAMREARREGPVYLQTDTHLSFVGNYTLYVAVMEALGVEPLPFEGLADLHPHTLSGDLGSRFEPRIVEISRMATTMGAARITEDNRDAVERGGGHIGSRRVYRNDSAPDQRRVVLYGDSYGFGSTAYQGLSWLLAQTFADVHFIWTPFGWDPGYADRVGADLVVSETAERFVPRVPAFEIDVDAICAAAVSRGGAVELDAVFSKGTPEA